MGSYVSCFEHFAKFTEKHWSLFIATFLLKKKQVFSHEFWEIFQITVITELLQATVYYLSIDDGGQ